VADALSRKVETKNDLALDVLSSKAESVNLTFEDDLDSQEGVLCMLSFPSLAWLTNLKTSYAIDHQLQGILQALNLGKNVPKGYSLQNGLLLYKGRIYLGTCEALKTVFLHQVHDSPLRGRSGFLKTLHRVKRDLYWLGLRADVRKLVRKCDTCQRLKSETCNPAGLLQPLPIPEKP